MNKLSSSDRSALIRLASSLPAGDENRKAILSGLKSAGSPVLVTAITYGGKVSTYDADEIQAMLSAPGVLDRKYISADNLPRWIWDAGAAKVLKPIVGKGLQWLPNYNAKKFPGGGWPIKGQEGWVQVGKILQDVLDSGRPVKMDVNSEDRSTNGMR